MNNMNNTHLQKGVLIIGMFLIAISLYCSFLLYTSFSERVSDKAAWGGMGLGLDLFKNVALLAALALWGLGFFAARILSVVVGLGYGLLTVLSFMAFFGFMSTVQHKLETQTVLASTKYQSLQGAVDSAEQKVESLSRYADSSAITEAKHRMTEIERKLAPIKQGMARYAHPDCSPKRDARGQVYATRAAEWCSRLEAVKAEALPWSEQVRGHEAYLAALAHRQQALDELAALDARDVATDSQAVHPMFVDLGRLLAQAPDEMKVVFMFVSSASAEILGTLSIVISTLLGQRRSYTLDEIESMTTQLRAQQPKLEHALAYSQKLVSLHEKPLAEPATNAYQQQASPILTGEVAEPAGPYHVEPEREREPTILEAYPEVEQPRIEILDLDSRYPAITTAILKGECPPHPSVLQTRYQMDVATARGFLDVMAYKGYLLKLPGDRGYQLNMNADEPFKVDQCGGVEYKKYSDLIKVFFPNPRAALPVRTKGGNVRWVSWGRRNNESSPLPTGSCARLDSINGGKWQKYSPRPVVIPAAGYMYKDVDNQNRWQNLAPSQGIQGLLAENGNERGIYVVTVEASNDDTLPGARQPRIIDMPA